MLELAPLFDSLALPVASSVDERIFSGLPIPGYELHRLGKNCRGESALLLATENPSPVGAPAPVVLENLTVQYEMKCRIREASGITEEGVFTVIQCTSEDQRVRSHFLTVATPLVLSIGGAPSRSKISGLINGLVEVFRALGQPPQKSVRGLWAELFLISRASNPWLLVSFWHAVPQDRYDFNAGAFRVEVKSAAGRQRKHHFSLEQLYPPVGTRLIVASLFLERAGGGSSLGDLISRIRARLFDRPDSLMHFDRVVCLAMGNCLHAALDERFDYELAEESLSFLDGESIPKLPAQLPAGISEVRFRVDLSEVPQVSASELVKSSALFRAILPQARKE